MTDESITVLPISRTRDETSSRAVSALYDEGFCSAASASEAPATANTSRQSSPLHQKHSDSKSSNLDQKNSTSPSLSCFGLFSRNKPSGHKKKEKIKTLNSTFANTRPPRPRKQNTATPTRVQAKQTLPARNNDMQLYTPDLTFTSVSRTIVIPVCVQEEENEQDEHGQLSLSLSWPLSAARSSPSPAPRFLDITPQGQEVQADKVNDMAAEAVVSRAHQHTTDNNHNHKNINTTTTNNNIIATNTTTTSTSTPSTKPHNHWRRPSVRNSWVTVSKWIE
jgi:hypothetical protein